jgi:hypothetical protein
MRGTGGDEDAPDLFEGDGLLCYWTLECRAPWQSERWKNEMRQALRPKQCARMIENKWVRGEGDFLEAEWDRSVHESRAAAVSRQSQLADLRWGGCVDDARLVRGGRDDLRR